MPYRPSFMPPFIKADKAPLQEDSQIRSLLEGGEVLKSVLPPITKGEKLTTGEFKKYFGRTLATNEIFEIGIRAYLTARANPVEYNAYELFEIEWKAINPSTDEVFNGYIREGSNTTNYKKVVEAEKIFKGIYNYLVKDKALKVTRLYTEGKQYKTRDEKAYLGYFHYTLEHGPCVGPEPIKDSVIKLYPITKVFTKFDK
jgi:hypothetical protein